MTHPDTGPSIPDLMAFNIANTLRFLANHNEISGHPITHDDSRTLRDAAAIVERVCPDIEVTQLLRAGVTG